MYLDALIGTTDLAVYLPNRINATRIGVVKIALPKTFDQTVAYIRLCADIAVPQLGGNRTLGVYPVHNTDNGPYLLVEPQHIQYRNLATVNFDTIRFSLTDQNNKPVQFETGKILISLDIESTDS